MDTSQSTQHLLLHIVSLLEKQSDQVLQEQLGIGLAQYKILRALQIEPKTTQREIARSLGQTEASVSRQAKLMLEQGLLHSLRNTEDHREHLTMVTRKGERLADAASDALARYHHPTFAALTDKQNEQLNATLSVLHRQLCPNVHADSVDV